MSALAGIEKEELNGNAECRSDEKQSRTQMRAVVKSRHLAKPGLLRRKRVKPMGQIIN
jgi:hypothetical protein